MNRMGGAAPLAAGFAGAAVIAVNAQTQRGPASAGASMTPQATLAAGHMLREGGNAFDAAVAGLGPFVTNR